MTLKLSGVPATARRRPPGRGGEEPALAPATAPSSMLLLLPAQSLLAVVSRMHMRASTATFFARLLAGLGERRSAERADWVPQSNSV